MKIQLALFIIQFGCLVFAENQTNTNSLFRPSFEASVRLHSMAASQTNELDFQNLHQISTSCLLAFSQLMERSDLRIASQPPVDFHGEIWRFCHSTSRRAKTTENQGSNEGGGIVGNSTEEESKNRSLRDHLARTILFCEMLTNIENHVEFQRREMANVALDLWVGNPACILREPVRRNIDGIPSVFYVLSVLGSYIYPDDIRKFARLMWDEFEKTDELPPGLIKPIRVEEVCKYIEKDPIRLEKRLNQLNCRAMGFDLLSVRESIRNELDSFPDETAKLRAGLKKLVAKFPSNEQSWETEDFRIPSILLLRFCSVGPEESGMPYVFLEKNNEDPSSQENIGFDFQKTFSDEQVETGRRRNHLARLLVFDRFLSWILEGPVPENIGAAMFNFMERNYVRRSTESALDPKAIRHLREDNCLRPLEAMRWMSTIPQIPNGGKLFMDARMMSKHSKIGTDSSCDENAPIPAVSQ